jgi:protein gp37
VSETTSIEWCDSTFNPWTGCTKVSPGCDHCYAEAWAKRSGTVQWGPHAQRRRTTAANWHKPLQWNTEAFWQCSSCGWRGIATDMTTRGEDFAHYSACPGCDADAFVAARRRVFCASLADVFDNQVPTEWRADLFELIRQTPHLDWLLLTKRPQNIVRMIHDHGAIAGNGTRYLPANVWLGTTAEDQKRANHNVIHLLRAKKVLGARIAFLSVEPMLEAIRLWMLTEGDYEEDPLGAEVYPLRGIYAVPDCDWTGPKLDWVICGGESGPGARPMHPDWARSLRDQCDEAGVPFLFKQWGEWAPEVEIIDGDPRIAMPERRAAAFDHMDGTTVLRVGKKAAGRLLDGRTRDEFPERVA